MGDSVLSSLYSSALSVVTAAQLAAVIVHANVVDEGLVPLEIALWA